jgi:hypothetical protein
MERHKEQNGMCAIKLKKKIKNKGNRDKIYSDT